MLMRVSIIQYVVITCTCFLRCNFAFIHTKLPANAVSAHKDGIWKGMDEGMCDVAAITMIYIVPTLVFHSYMIASLPCDDSNCTCVAPELFEPDINNHTAPLVAQLLSVHCVLHVYFASVCSL